MKLIHTADVHLRKGDEKRMEIFQWLLGKAEEIKADCCIIAGDLFHSDTDARALRPTVKSLLESRSMKFIVIPGNHDVLSYGSDYDYGANVIQLVGKPSEIIELEGIKICGIPYQEKKFSECIKDTPRDTDIIVAHGTLYDESFIFSLLEDKETEYMPIYPANLENKARYVALGHLHTNRVERKYKKTTVVYPGSPVALDTKCVEPRSVSILTIDQQTLVYDSLVIDIAPYWLKRELFVFPGNEQHVVAELQSYLTNNADAHSMPSIIINGFIAQTDRAFTTAVSAIEKQFEKKFLNLKIEVHVTSWDTIVQNRMVRNFVDKTAELDNDLRMKVFEITFPIFNEYLQ